MEQRRFWPRRRPRRAIKIALSERGVYEPVETEENVLTSVTAYLWRCGIPVFRVRERVPICRNCGAKVCGTSEAGHPDLHGYVPVRSVIRWAKDDAAKEFLTKYLKHPIPYFIEMKRPKGGRHRLSQTYFLTRVEDDGVLGCFAKSIAEVQALFVKAGIFLPDPNAYTV